MRALRRRTLAGLTVVALLGGIGRGSEINMYETASRVAETLGAQCYYLAAPAFAASSDDARHAPRTRPGLATMLGRARRADIALVSVGTLGPGATNRRIGLLGDAEDAAELIAAGAVGDLLCTSSTTAGRPSTTL